MDKTLWEKVQDFDFDKATEQYGFSTRLALENHWTLYFTQVALLEYKKFMFLAATSDEMVSPSEIVDIVWHQHLIFTNSYTDFCNLLGKRIEHIPSTHNRLDFEMFNKAKERTKELYEINFGKQPEAVWHYTNELDSLQLDESKFDIFKLQNKFLIYAIVLSFPICFLIFPLLIKINNPYFLISWIIGFVLAIKILELYSTRSLVSLYEKIKLNPILQNLTAFELVFLKESKLEAVVHCVVDNMIKRQKIKILMNKKLELIDENFGGNKYENCIIEIMKGTDSMPYKELCYAAMQKPIFEQLKKGTYRIKERIMTSKKFFFVIILVMVVLGVFLTILFSRCLTGIYRGKPIILLVFVTIAAVLISLYYLNKFIGLMFTKIIPSTYQEEITKNRDIENNWEWNYFLYGSVVLSSFFVPLTHYNSNNTFSSDSGSSSSCGSSCSSSGGSCGSSGSSCGSSCGGCGGGD